MKEDKTAYEKPELIELDSPCTLVGDSGCPAGNNEEDIPGGGCGEADDI